MNDLIGALKRLKVNTNSLACLGCGREHNCSVHGCAIIRAAVEQLEKQRNQEWVPCKERLPVPEDREIWVHCLVTLRENALDRFWEEESHRSYTLPAEYDPVQKIWHFEASEPGCAHAQVNALLGEEIMTDEDGEMVDACYVSHWMPYPKPATEDPDEKENRPDA